MLSGLYGYRSLVAASEKQYRTAIQSGMTGFKYTRQLLALDADDPRALIGKGVFYYMMGSVPRELKWMTNMAGLSGNKEEGFKALEQAAGSQSYISNDAKMILAYLYERENRNEMAVSKLRELSRRYPQNIIFKYNLARLLEKCDQPSEAKARYQEVLALKNNELQTLREKSRLRLQKL
jgi:tetratricopeptide (TPR) repeat protein